MVIYQWAGVYNLQTEWATNRAAEGWLVFDVDSHDVTPDQTGGVPKVMSPRWAMPGITREAAMPRIAAGSMQRKPASGPAIPTSNNTCRE